MQLIAEKKSQSDKYDRLRFVRADGSSTECQMPRQGILPHDLVHYVVESALPLQHGFLSQLARGAEAQFVMEAVHDPANKDVETEAVQAEAIVEGLQSQLWSGAFDRDYFMDGAATACTARGKTPFDFSRVAADLPEMLFQRAQELNRRWLAVPFYGSLELSFEA